MCIRDRYGEVDSNAIAYIQVKEGIDDPEKAFKILQERRQQEEKRKTTAKEPGDETDADLQKSIDLNLDAINKGTSQHTIQGLKEALIKLNKNPDDFNFSLER